MQKGELRLNPPLLLLPRWQNQQRGLFNWGRGDGGQQRGSRCSHNRQYQHAAVTAVQPPPQCPCSRGMNGRWRDLSPGTRIWTSGQWKNDKRERESAGLLGGQYKSGIVGHKGTERGAGLEARSTRPAALFNLTRVADVNPDLESYITG